MGSYAKSSEEEFNRLKAIDKDYQVAKEQWATDRSNAEHNYQDLKKSFENILKYAADLDKHNQGLQEELDDAKKTKGKDAQGSSGEGLKEGQTLTLKVADLQKENLALQKEKLACQEQEKELRNQLRNAPFPGGHHEQLIDATVIVPFADLRKQIQSIATNFYDVTRTPIAELVSSSSNQFFSYWSTTPSESQKRYWLRGKLFILLRDGILQYPCFGIDGLDSNGHREHGLAKFEMLLRKIPPGRETDIINWRVQTIKCTGWFDAFAKSRIPEEKARLIYDFMVPLLPLGYESEELSKSLMKLCWDAFRLTLVLRSSHDLYRFEQPSFGSAVDAGEVEPQFTVGETEENLKAPVIFLILFGSLVKYPANNPGHRVVLEKAHVVIRDRT